MSSDAFKAQLAQLNAEYRAALPGKLADIDALWVRHADAAALTDLHRQLHTLAGSAKVFGIAAVSSAAREAENALSVPVHRGTPPDAAERLRVDGLLEALRQAAR